MDELKAAPEVEGLLTRILEKSNSICGKSNTIRDAIMGASNVSNKEESETKAFGLIGRLQEIEGVLNNASNRLSDIVEVF